MLPALHAYTQLLWMSATDMLMFMLELSRLVMDPMTALPSVCVMTHCASYRFVKPVTN